jgi:hypothetical protein
MSRRRRVLATLSLAALAAAVAAGIAVTRDGAGSDEAAASGPGSSPTTSVTPSDDAAPADEADATEEAPTDEVAPEPVGDGTDPESGQTLATDAPVVSTGAAVPVKVTFHDWNAAQRQVMVGGYVPGLVEDGGTCTLTLTQAGKNVSAKVSATADASSTACGAVTVAGNRLGAGTWQAVLSYASGAHSGAAPAVAIEVTP